MLNYIRKNSINIYVVVFIVFAVHIYFYHPVLQKVCWIEEQITALKNMYIAVHILITAAHDIGVSSVNGHIVIP